MLKKQKKSLYKKIALVLSLCTVILWAVLGTGASLAWFTDPFEELRNIFHLDDYDIEVSYRLENGKYEKIGKNTRIFDDDALYEPGYVQVVYLKIENKGTVPVDFKTAVNVTDYTTAKNVFGQSFQLQDYLRFGLVTADSEKELTEKVDTSDMAEKIADMKLNNYSTDVAELGAKQTVYMALIVRMPKEVSKEANYRGNTVPKVELGIIVSATQQKNR